MSWNSYISDQLVGSGNVKKAAIMGHDGATWAASADFAVTADEGKKLVGAFTDPTALRAGGMHIAGTKYFFLSGTEDVLRGKKDKMGVHVAKTKTGIIVAMYEEPILAGQCANTVEALADYLKSVNY